MTCPSEPEAYNAYINTWTLWTRIHGLVQTMDGFYNGDLFGELIDIEATFTEAAEPILLQLVEEWRVAKGLPQPAVCDILEK